MDLTYLTPEQRKAFMELWEQRDAWCHENGHKYYGDAGSMSDRSEELSSSNDTPSNPSSDTYTIGRTETSEHGMQKQTQHGFERLKIGYKASSEASKAYSILIEFSPQSRGDAYFNIEVSQGQDGDRKISVSAEH